MRTGSFIGGLLQERTGVLGVSLSVSFSYYIIIAAQPNKACLAEVEAQVSGFCYQILYLGSLCRRYVRGPWGRIKGRLEDPSGLSDCVDCVVGCEFVFDSCDSWGFAGMGWMVVF